MKRRTFLSLMGAAALTSGMMFTGCGAGSDGDDRKIVRIGHVQSQTHPDHLGLEAFANYINEKLGDKYRVEVYPSELLGSQTEMVQLTQTGAIDFVVASTAIMETFSAKYQIFNLPYLFSSVEAYHEAMDDPEVTDPIFKTTSKAGLETVAWLDAGTRNFYTIKTPINHSSSAGTEDCCFCLIPTIHALKDLRSLSVDRQDLQFINAPDQGIRNMRIRQRPHRLIQKLQHLEFVVKFSRIIIRNLKKIKAIVCPQHILSEF